MQFEKNYTFEIEDNNVKKTLIISKLSGFNFINLLLRITKLIIDTDQIKSSLIKQYIHNWAQSGVSIEKATKEEIDKFNQKDEFDIIYDIVTSVISNINEIEQYEIYNRLISCVSFMNGTTVINLDNIPNSDRNIDLYIKEYGNIFKILIEVIKFHISGINKKKDNQNL